MFERVVHRQQNNAGRSSAMVYSIGENGDFQSLHYAR